MVCICIEVGVLLVGTETGRVVCHRWPPTDFDEFSANYVAVRVFQKSVKKLRVSADRKRLYAVSAEGNVCTIDLQIYEEGEQLTPEAFADRLSSFGVGSCSYNMEGLVLHSRTSLESQLCEIEDLRLHCELRIK